MFLCQQGTLHRALVIGLEQRTLSGLNACVVGSVGALRTSSADTGAPLSRVSRSLRKDSSSTRWAFDASPLPYSE